MSKVSDFDKELKLTKPMEFLISETSKKSKKNIKIKEAKITLNICKGKTKDKKECTRKESKDCNGFCKQHFILEKEKANTIILIEKHMKIV